MSGADLRVTRMEGVNLENANLLEVNWHGAKMYGAYFSNTVMPDGELVTEPNSYE
ncbi:MAG: pentapeptide repeat-containing protein [Nostoc sp.]|uniref:pentapeptide repeat-containing protein n=1 Tax=Nostoc sp. TaxID=1180 RepID=UPI002FF9D3D5